MFSKGPAKYAIHFDTTVKIITGSVFALVLFLMSFSLYENIIEYESSMMASILGFTIPVVVICIPWVYRPQYYYLDKDALIVIRSISNVSLPYADIETIESIGAKDLRGMLRLFGSGGLFGYYGLFYSPKYGKIRSYITSKEHLVLITMKDGTKHLFSPTEDGMPGHILDMKLGR